MPGDVARFKFRLVLLGSHQTGKTSILNRFLFKKFETKYRATVEDLFTKDFDLGSVEIQVDFLDTSGSMQFPAMRRLSITTGSAFMIVYAVDDASSYDVLKQCVAEIQDIRPDFQEIPIVFAGNKCDIPREKRQILKETVSNYVHYELPRLRAKVIECSCRDNINIDNLFRAYLSLAKVNLAGALQSKRTSGVSIPIASQQRRPELVTAANNKIADYVSEDISSNRRSSSMKDALGVRKSCDATILTPTRRKESQLSSSQPKQGQANQGSPMRATKGLATATHLTAHANETTAQDQEVNLATAIKTTLHVSGQSADAKPRSRSLIWRPVRKSRNSCLAESSECRLS